MTLPTKLTVLRLVLTFIIMGLLFLPGWVAKAAALGGFVIAALTDWLDGYLARRWDQASPLGALLDPIADKVLILGMFLAFVQLRLIPAWMVLVIACREFLITGVRLVASGRGLVLPAAKEGKHKLLSQVATILLILVVVLIEELSAHALSRDVTLWMHGLVFGSLWITMVLTVVSGAGFFWRHRHVLMGL